MGGGRWRVYGDRHRRHNSAMDTNLPRPHTETPISDNTVTMALVLTQTLRRHHGNRWRFSDGEITFYACMLDENFIRRANNGEGFCKGDVLQVELSIKQTMTSSRISIDRQVLRVLEHQATGRQRPFL